MNLSAAFPLLLSVVAITGTMLCQPAFAGLLTSGDLLVGYERMATASVIKEFTTSGTLKQSFSVPIPPSGSSQARGLTLDSNGDIEVFNGPLSPYLTATDPLSGTFIANSTATGW